MERIITNSMIGDFENFLRSDEKSDNTIEKYLRDVKAFCMFAEARRISKVVVMEFKASLVETYEVTESLTGITKKSRKNLLQTLMCLKKECS